MMTKKRTRKTPPWQKFQRWLNRQNPRAIAGTQSVGDNVIAKYLQDRLDNPWIGIGIGRLVICKAGRWDTRVANGPTPAWAAYLLALLWAHPRDSYTYATVKKWLAEVKKA